MARPKRRKIFYLVQFMDRRLVTGTRSYRCRHPLRYGGRATMLAPRIVCH